MSFFDSASLVQIPSGVKDGVLYSVKPIDGSGDLTFTRGSDIEATRVAANGYIEKAQVNLLLQSNSFDTTWVNVATTETGGQADKDGGTSAWKLEASSGGSSRRIEQTNALTGVCTFSVYAKAGNISYLALENGSQFTYVSLVDGTQGNNSGLIDYAATSVGNGWWRISIVLDKAASSDLRIYLASSATSTVVSGGDYIYIQDAQLNYGLVAQTYQETTTAAVVSGITNDMPRLSYDPANPTCPSLLLEPSRSNIIADSEFFNNTSVWTQNPQITIDDNQDTSPEGVVNASRIYNNTGSETTIFYGASVNVGSAGTYTFSIFAKKGGLGWIRVRCLGFDAAANNNCWFDLENGVKGTNTFDEANIEDYGNGWFRISVKFTTSTDLTGTCYVYAADGDNDTTVASGASYYLSVYGAQLEAGNFVSSYIPTYGSSATRTADDSYLLQTPTDADTFTYFFEVEAPNFQSGGGELLLENAGASSQVRVYLNNSSTGLLRLRTDNPAYNYDHTYASLGIAVGDTLKIALSINNGVMKGFINGVLETTAVAATISFGRIHYRPNANIILKQSLYFDYAMSDADAITLTTL